MTTDTVPKLARSEGSGYVIGGMVKAAGMPAPGLATRLVFSPPTLVSMLPILMPR